MKIKLQNADVRKIQEHGCPNTTSHVIEIDVTPKGLPRRKAIRLMLPFALLTMSGFDFAGKSKGGS